MVPSMPASHEHHQHTYCLSVQCTRHALCFSTNSLPGIGADWTQLGDFEQTTPIADLLQEIQAEGVPTTENQVCFSFFSP